MSRVRRIPSRPAFVRPAFVRGCVVFFLAILLFATGCLLGWNEFRHHHSDRVDEIETRETQTLKVIQKAREISIATQEKNDQVEVLAQQASQEAMEARKKEAAATTSLQKMEIERVNAVRFLGEAMETREEGKRLREESAAVASRSRETVTLHQKRVADLEGLLEASSRETQKAVEEIRRWKQTDEKQDRAISQLEDDNRRLARSLREVEEDYEDACTKVRNLEFALLKMKRDRDRQRLVQKP